MSLPTEIAINNNTIEYKIRIDYIFSIRNDLVYCFDWVKFYPPQASLFVYSFKISFYFEGGSKGVGKNVHK